MTNSIEDTLNHAVFFARHLNRCKPESAVIAILLELGVPVKNIGFDYLAKAVTIYLENPSQILTKEIYPAVGKCFTPAASSYQVEQTIRRSITEAWRTRNDEVWRIYFPPKSNGIVKKPSNREFISMLGKFLRLWQDCCEEVI